MTMLQHGLVPSTGGYQIERSLRFNSADSAYLNRTPSSTTNQKTFTWSSWVKLSSDTPYRTLFSSGTTVPGFINFEFEDRAFTSPDLALIFNVASGAYAPKTTAVFRDFSAWYHIVVAVDTTQATESNRVKLYVNGVQQTLSAVGIPQNTDLPINTNVVHSIGRRNLNSNPDNYFNGYITDVYLIDGSTPTTTTRTVGGVTETVLTQFGEFDTDTGVWKPKAYSGSYGTNGFYLKFADNSGTTSTTLGKDSSGNGNNWTPNNFSVTAGVGNDSLVDTPTPYGTDTGAGGEVRGNYATLNPLTTTTGTYTQGNLRYAGSNSGKQSNGTISVSTGKWYWEVTLGNAPFTPRAGNTDYNSFGFALPTTFDGAFDISNATTAIALADNGYYKNFTNARVDGGTAFSSGDVLAIAVDLDANTFTFYRNNSQLATGTIGGTAGRTLCPFIGSYSGAYGVMDCNFGQRPFAYTAPSGFKALCTQNLPTPTIGATATSRADDYFNTVLWSGDSTGTTRSISGVGFQPDFVWIKARNQPYRHTIYDAVRGAAADKYLSSSTNDAEGTSNYAGLYGYVSAFQSDGFQLTKGTDPSDQYAWINQTGTTYVGWNWKANGAGSTNNAGSIQSTVSANTTAGFSIVTYTGNSTAGATVGHGLNVAPKMVIVKNRNSTQNWIVWHTNLSGAGYNLYLNLTDSQQNDNQFQAIGTTTLTLGGAVSTNTNNNTYVAYCFSEVAGYSKFGSYTGNGSTDGPMVFTGFRPKFILIKCSSNGDYWWLKDSARNPYNLADLRLAPNLSDAESNDASFNGADFLSNGFKLRGSDTTTNGSARTYVYAAFAEIPTKFSLAR